MLWSKTKIKNTKTKIKQNDNTLLWMGNDWNVHDNKRGLIKGNVCTTRFKFTQFTADKIKNKQNEKQENRIEFDTGAFG